MLVDCQKSVPVTYGTDGPLSDQFRPHLPVSSAKSRFRKCDAVCFDVDSTVCVDEGIDELAKFKGCDAKVAAVTRSAMGGNVGFRRALRDRLDLIRPSKMDLDNFVDAKPPRLTQGIAQLVCELQRRGTHVYLVSGGFRHLIEPIALKLNILLDNVFANRILFDDNGHYSGFDETEPTSDCGGKAAVCGLLKKTKGYRCLIMIGDGATDLQARPPADCFIGFGANARRAPVENGADWFVTSCDEMMQELGRVDAK